MPKAILCCFEVSVFLYPNSTISPYPSVLFPTYFVPCFTDISSHTFIVVISETSYFTYDSAESALNALAEPQKSRAVISNSNTDKYFFIL